MGTELTSNRMAEVLPGRWRIRASNLVHWLSGERMHPLVELQVSSAEPLVIAEEVRFALADGKHRTLRSRAVWNGENFVSRGSRLLRPGFRHWSLGGASDDGSIVVVRHRVPRSALGRPAAGGPAFGGIDVMVRDGVDPDGVRAMVARDVEAFRLSLEDFASLGWFPEGHR